MLINQLPTFGQDGNYDWWNEIHGWEAGDPHWSHYIIINPGNMGPNALPVPDVYESRLDSAFQYEVRYDQFSHPGDRTSDIAINFYLPIAKGAAAIRMQLLQEWYDMDDNIRDERRARTTDAKGSTTGDLIFEFKAQILKDHIKFPDLSFHAGLKTASGGDFQNARHTDAPAYNFALSTGKSYKYPGKFIQNIRWNLMLGFYAWQTFITNNRQNDAPLYGFSLALNHANWTFENSLSGYYGYLDEGEYPAIYGDIPKSDHPLVYKSQVSYQWNKWLAKFAFKKGFASFKYDVFQLGFAYRFIPEND